MDKIEKNVNSDEDSTEVEANLLEITEPENIEEALSSLQSHFWKQAVAEKKNLVVKEMPKDKKCIVSVLNLKSTHTETR